MTLTAQRNCPICDSRRNTEAYAERHIDESQLSRFSFASRKLPEYMHHRLLLCHGCDLLFAEPQEELNLGKAYEQAAFDSGRESACAAVTYRRVLAGVLGRLPERAGLLDIGAGDGAFLREMLRAGFREMIGLEPSEAPIRAADSSVRGMLQQGMFGQELFEPGRFSLITCFQTIEHVTDPLGLCKEACRLLQPGGAFAIIAHNRRGVVNRLLGRKSPIFDVEHLQLFSERSIEGLMKAAGFSEIRAEGFWNSYPLSYWARLFPLPAGFKRLVLAGLQRTFGSIPVKLPVGNMLCVGFGKG
jgi:2-polyprenyl-3-methyl-5-hydroxy-6-metoxy-1,4-benzoquinol methylase